MKRRAPVGKPGHVVFGRSALAHWKVGVVDLAGEEILHIGQAAVHGDAQHFGVEVGKDFGRSAVRPKAIGPDERSKPAFTT
jgi:hypothetical protein